MGFWWILAWTTPVQIQPGFKKYAIIYICWSNLQTLTVPGMQIWSHTCMPACFLISYSSEGPSWYVCIPHCGFNGRCSMERGTIQMSNTSVMFLALAGLPAIVWLDRILNLFDMHVYIYIYICARTCCYSDCLRIHLLDYINQVSTSPTVRNRVPRLQHCTHACVINISYAQLMPDGYPYIKGHLVLRTIFWSGWSSWWIP